jgi:hypothetical protein
MALVPTLLLPFLAALVGLAVFWPAARWYPTQALRICLAFGLALGLSSCTFFLWLAVVGPERGHLALTEALCVAGALAAVVVASRWLPHLGPELRPVATPPGRLLPLTLAVTLACAVARFVLVSVTSPHGAYDAWGIWNLRARFLFRGGRHWTDAFLMERSPVDWSHPDYPLLLPGTVARCWYHLGHETTLVPVLVAGLFTLATVGLLVSALTLLRGPRQGCLAGLVLLGTTFFVDLGSFQYADVPLGFFILAATTLCVLHDRFSDGDGRLLVLAGLLTGCAAWTKNEGLSFLVAVVLARAFLAARVHGWRRSGRELRAFGLGVLPVAAVLIVFKTQFAPPNDLVAEQGLRATVARLTDVSRYVLVGEAFATELRHIGPWAVVLLAVYFVLLGRAPRPGRAGSMFPVLVLGLMMAAYLLVYLTTPRPLSWHLYTSLDRLLMHLWPTALLTYFLVVATPEEALADNQAARPSRTRPAPAGRPVQAAA